MRERSQVWWVVHVPTGRTGMVLETTARKAFVQFGSSGPIDNVWKRELRDATDAEIRRMEGC